MKLETIIAERISQLRLFSGTPCWVEAQVEEFEQAWRELGRELVEQQLQAQVEAVEAKHRGAPLSARPLPSLAVFPKQIHLQLVLLKRNEPPCTAELSSLKSFHSHIETTISFSVPISPWTLDVPFC